MERPQISKYASQGAMEASRVIRHDGGQQVTTFNWFSVPNYQAVFDRMISRNGRGKWNECSHYSKYCQLFDNYWNFQYGTYEYRNIRTSGIIPKVYGTAGSPVSGAKAVYSDMPEDHNFIVMPTDLQSLIDRSLRAMLPGIRPRLSLLNSLYELKDFRTLPNTLGRILKAGTKLTTLLKDKVLLRSCKTLARNGVKSTIRSISRAAADIKLQTNFNVLPLLSDISGVTATLSNIHKQVSHLLANEGKLERRHFRCPLDGYVDVTESVVATNANSWYPDSSIWYDGVLQSLKITPSWVLGGLTVSRETRYQNAWFHATIEYEYSLTQYERDNALLHGYLDSLGVNFNPAIVWNAIPWSFAIDWVIGVSRWLDQFKIRLLEPKTSIHRYGYSIDIDRTIGIYYTIPNQSYVAGTSHRLASLTTERAYYRSGQYDPGWYRSLEMSGIDSKEFILGLALAITRGRD